jgi:hypothetical protein
MICAPCATAADLATALRAGLEPIAWTWPQQTPEVGGKEMIVTPAVLDQIHSLCQGCDCQHRINLDPAGATT